MRRLTALTTALALLAGLALGAPAPVAAVASTIYVGSADDASGASSCADPDYSTDASDEVTIEAALEAALAAVDADGDTVIICDGSYTYTADFSGVVVPFTFSIEAETSGAVTLDGDAHQILAVDLDDVGEVLTIEGIVFENGETATDGGAVSVSYGSVTVLDSSFTGNTAAGHGGAIYMESGVATISDSSFTGNTADEGGAICLFFNDITLTRVRFLDNVASGYGGAVACLGLSLTVRFSLFQGNSAGWHGGAIDVHQYAGTIIERSQFIDNHAGQEGGALGANGSDLDIRSSLFQGNTAGEQGGAIWFRSNVIKIVRSTFKRNVSESVGGAIAIPSYRFRRVSRSLSRFNRFSRNRAISSRWANIGLNP